MSCVLDWLMGWNLLRLVSVGLPEVVTLGFRRHGVGPAGREGLDLRYAFLL